jgi:DNA-binding GntR family transcriptional regulator
MAFRATRKRARAVKQKRSKKPLEDLVNRIAVDIQSRVFGPGTWLKQIDLEQRYKCTRINLRRAFDQLVAKRLVQHVPNRGYHVYAPDPRQHAELQDIRLTLELRAAELIMASAGPQDIGEMEALAQRFDDLLLEGTVFEQYDANIAFHKRLLDNCTNRELAALIMETRARGPSAPVFEWKTRARMEQSSREHFAMVEALKSRQLARLQNLITAHIRQTEASSDVVAPLPRRTG